MAALSITATDVIPASVPTVVLWGETMTAGCPVYKHTDNKYYKCLNDTAAHAACVGFSCSGGAANQYGGIVAGGVVAVGAVFTDDIGKAYYVGASAGTLVHEADLTTGVYTTRVGYNLTSDDLTLDIKATGTAYHS